MKSLISTRSRVCIAVIGLAATLLPSVAAAQDAPADSRPNVLVILVDDLGYSDLSSYGGEVPTPNIDALAHEGLRFTQTYNSARCCPSRASLVTGLYPHQAGIGSFVSDPDPERGPAYLGRLSDQCVTFAQVLKSAGYQTFMVGKWHMNLPGPIEHGFDEFYGFVRGYSQGQWDPRNYQRLPEGHTPELSYEPGAFYATDVFSDYALAFLNEAHKQADRPWLMYLAYSSPHFPLQAPKETVDKYMETYRRGWDVLRQERFERQKQIGLATDSWTLPPRSIVPLGGEEKTAGYAGEDNPAWDTLPADRREDLARRMAIFAAMVEHVDTGVGRITDYLKETGQFDNTLILFLSDNGACYEWGPYGFDGPDQRVPKEPHQTPEQLAGMGGPGTWLSYGSSWANLGNTPLRMYKHFTQEGGICTPMIAHWPKGISEPDRWVREPTDIIDVMPTLCEVGKATYPEELDGQTIIPEEGASLVPIFWGGSLGERPLFFEHQEARAMRQGPWKIVWSKYEPREIRWELYNIDEDRCETHDLAGEQPGRVQAMADAWLAWAKRVKVYPFFEQPD